MNLKKDDKLMYGMLRAQTLSNLILLTYEEYDMKRSLILQSRFQNAMKIAVEEIDRSSKKIYNTASLSMLGQTDEMNNIFSMVINATINAYCLTEEQASEMIRRVKSIMTDFEVCERESDYVALYTLKEAEAILRKKND